MRSHVYDPTCIRAAIAIIKLLLRLTYKDISVWSSAKLLRSNVNVARYSRDFIDSRLMRSEGHERERGRREEGQ